ncbi:MAG TPA: hypothetical protein VKD90_06080 [Gemmataceae bacterium]|nr:hypothetical protein [Gemmataceae bacterium]
MRQFFSALTFATGLCLALPGPASARGVLGGPEPPPPEQSREDILAEKEAARYTEYFLGSLATLVATTVIVQFYREVSGGAAYTGLRIFTYSARTDRYAAVDEDDADDYETSESRYETDF